MGDTPKVVAGAIQIPQNLQVATTRALSPTSLQQVKQSLAPVVQQLVQAAGIQLSAADKASLQTAFLARGIISIPSAADDGISVNVEATSLTYNSSRIAVVAEGAESE